MRAIQEPQAQDAEGMYDTSPLESNLSVANIAVDSIVTAKAKMGDPSAQLVKLKIMKEQLAANKKERNKDGVSKPALLSMDEIAESMVNLELKARLGL